MMRESLRNAARWTARHVGSHGLILVYHRVAELRSDPWKIAVSPRHFGEQMAVLRRHYRPMPLRDLTADVARHRVTHGSIAVTFDDGYVDNFEVARPILEAHGIPATMFITAGTLGQTTEYWWDELERILLSPHPLPPELCVEIGSEHDRIGPGTGAPRTYRWDLRGAEQYTEADAARHIAWQAWTAPPGPRQKAYQELWHLLLPLPANERDRVLRVMQEWAGVGNLGRPSYRTMEASQIPVLAASGSVEVGAHSMTHAQLASLDVAGQRWEIRESRRILEELTGRPVTSFAYPFGGENHFTDETVRLLREHGFERAVINVSRFTSRRSNLYRLPRVHVNDLDGQAFHRLLSSWLPPLSLRSARLW